jgi:hypothetical protein
MDAIEAVGKAPLLVSDLNVPWPNGKLRIPVKSLAWRIIDHQPRHRYSGVKRITLAIWRMLDPERGGQPVVLQGHEFSTEFLLARPSGRLSLTVVRRPVDATARLRCVDRRRVAASEPRKFRLSDEDLFRMIRPRSQATPALSLTLDEALAITRRARG